MRICSITDKYINYLRRFSTHIMDPKIGKRRHSRKYIGVVLRVDNHMYFAPLSSPKPRDYDSSGNIYYKSRLSMPMVTNEPSGKRLLGTIKFNDMIPVPRTEIIQYNLDDERDTAYANLVRDELRFISKHQTKILKRARFIYEAKTHEARNANQKNVKWFAAILPFKELEVLCDAFVSQTTNTSIKS